MFSILVCCILCIIKTIRRQWKQRIKKMTIKMQTSSKFPISQFTKPTCFQIDFCSTYVFFLGKMHIVQIMIFFLLEYPHCYGIALHDFKTEAGCSLNGFAYLFTAHLWKDIIRVCVYVYAHIKKETTWINWVSVLLSVVSFCEYILSFMFFSHLHCLQKFAEFSQLLDKQQVVCKTHSWGLVTITWKLPLRSKNSTKQILGWKISFSS